MRSHRTTPPGAASTRVLLLLGGALVALGGPAVADSPSGGVVVKGKAAISQKAGRTRIHQRSNRAVVDWQGFDVGRDHRVVFDQPGKSSATLNRVESAGRSVIEGAIAAPGTVVIQNRAGVLFTKDARIDVGGLVAASQDVDAERFARDGRLAIGGGEWPGARVVNEGRITVGAAGLAALVGSNVANAGEIVAHRGTAALASGRATTIDFAGDGLVRLVVAGDAPGATPGVANRGLIDVGEGRVVLSAGSAARALDAAINTTGVIRATASDGDGGRVELTGRGAGEIRIAGEIDVSGARRGGALTATGAEIAVEGGARIAARGGRDGGTVRLGGDRHGIGPLRRATALTMEAGARIEADGASGHGGAVVLWSDGVTRHDGSISAVSPFAGGFVETSGRFALEVGPSGSVEVGPGGRWLLDPRDVVIGTGGLTPVPPGVTPPPPGGTSYNINRLAVINTLNGGGDVTITTVQPGSSMAGDITVAGPLAWTGAGRLRLEAERDIALTATMTTGGGGFTAVAARDIVSGGLVTVGGDGDFALDAGGGLTVNQTIRATGAGGVALRARTGDLAITESPASNVIVSTTTGTLSLAADVGSVRLRRVNPAAGANIQVFSGSGPVDLTAGTEIRLDGGQQGGRWVRLGQVGSSSDLTLAAPEIKVRGGGVGNTFAEVVAGPGGSITMDADLIRVLNGAGDQGRIQALGGASLTLRGEAQQWNGPVRAGNGAGNGGDVVIAGAVVAGFQPQLSLAPGASFTFLPEAPNGAISRYDSTQPFVVTTSGTGGIEIDAPVVAQQITLESSARVGLGPAGRLTGEGAGDALVVAAGQSFRNNATAGAAALGVTDAGARWLLYLDAFTGLTGAAPAPRAFDLYGRTYDDTPPPGLGFDGDRIVYGERPTLTLTGETLSKDYGTAATPGFAVAGLRAGDSLATALVGQPVATSDGAAAASDVADYATVVAAEASDQGYILAFADGALAVTPARLTVTANDTSRSYGAANPTLTARFDGFVLGQDARDLGGDLALATPAAPASDVGTYAIRASGLTSGNYAIAYQPGALAVTPARLTVTPEGARTYGGADADFDARFDGFVLGQDPGDLGGTLRYATPAASDSDAGAYALTARGLTSANYAISYLDGTLTIDPARLTVTANDTSRSYGAANPTLTARFDGFVLGQDPRDLGGDLALATPAAAASDVGTYAIRASGLTSGNYAIAYQPGALAVTPARLTVTANDTSRSYGAANPTLTARFDGFVLGQDARDLGGDLALATPAAPASDVGTYAIRASGLTSGNYAIAYQPGALAVTPARLTVTPEGARTYGGADADFDARFDGFVLGQDPGDLGGTLRYATPAASDSDAGAYALTARGLTSANYAISYLDGTLTIDPARLTVTANDTSRSYGAANPTLTARFDGFVLGQDPGDLGGDLALATPAAPASDVGTYAIRASGLTSGNYAIAYQPGALAVTPARLTVTPEGARTYGGSDADFDARFDGFVLGQDPRDLGGTLRYATPAASDSDAGAYALTARGLTSANYAISYLDGTLTIDPARLTVTANDATRAEGARNPAFTARYEGFVLGQDASVLGGRLDFASPATPASSPGSYAIAPGGLASGNYAIAYRGGLLTVRPAPPGPSPTPAPTFAGLDRGVETFGRGAPPLTPGDSAFRTTQTEAPTARDSTFELTYSLGEIAQLAPAELADTGGFVPAAGGGAEPAAATCSGPIAPAAPQAGCVRRSTAESFWTTAFPEAAR